jgi:very-short-patch-repair endonuclease
LPEAELNAEVFAEDGHFIARVDFLWREARVVVEYEGDHHRTDRRQWQSDIQRTRLLESIGWRVIRITSADLRGTGLTRLVSELRRLVA